MYFILNTLFDRPDVLEAYNDMARLGIMHGDVRWRNILNVPLTSQRSICPNHKRIHQWYPIDFDLAEKCNGRLDYLNEANEKDVGRLLDALPYNCVVEPWE